MMALGVWLASSSLTAGVLVGAAVLLAAGGLLLSDFIRRMRQSREAHEQRTFHKRAGRDLTAILRDGKVARAQIDNEVGSALKELQKRAAEPAAPQNARTSRLGATQSTLAEGSKAPTPASQMPVTSQSVTAPQVAVKAPGPLPPLDSLNKKSRAYAPIGSDLKPNWISSRQAGGEFKPPSGTTSAYRASALPYSHEIPVAIIADDFTYESFRSEFDTHRLLPSNWRQVMDATNPRVFFCESAWQGGPPAEHPWQGKIYASVRFTHENRKVLLEILEYCKARGIPTVFWNKEDPIHFSDRINDFIRTAALFDYVFTTAEECVPMYIRDVGVPWAGTLPFAVQPRIFNPVGAFSKSDTVNFAGSWYRRYPERAAAAATILDRVLDSGRELIIYDRMHSSTSDAYAFPERFKTFTRPAIPYIETAQAYKRSKFGITLNTITESKTMFARRVFELAASGTVVLSNTASGVQSFFGDSVLYLDGANNPLTDLSDEDFKTRQREAMAIAFENTYRHRAETILDAVGIRHSSMVGRMQLVGTVRRLSDVQKIDAFRARHEEAIESVLYVVSDEADPTLVFELGRSVSTGGTVVSERELHHAEYRDRSIFGARVLLFFDPSLGDIAPEEMRLLHSMGTAIDQPIRMATSDDSRYRFGRATSLHGVVAQAHQAQPLLRNVESASVFGV